MTDLEGVADFLLRAAAASELAENRIDPSSNEEYVDEAVLARAYADGAFDAMRFMFNLASPTDALIEVLRAGRGPHDDLPEDDAVLGYPPIRKALA